MEIFSPEGKCQHSLALIPSVINRNILLLYKNQILSCGGLTTTNCYIYFPKNNTWNLYAIGPSDNYYSSNAVYQGKFYLSKAETTTPLTKIYDLATKTWTSSWPIPPDVSYLGCLVQWEDSFIRFGGQSNLREILQYNITLKTWTSLNSSSFPMDVWRSGCATLPNKKIFIMGGINSPKEYAIYDVVTNSWPIYSQLIIRQYDVSVLVLSNRVFALTGGSQSIIQEYYYLNDTFTSLSLKLKTIRTNYPGILSVPANLFSYLPGGCIGIK